LAGGMISPAADSERFRLPVEGGARAALAAACLLLVAGFVGIWILGQNATGATVPDTFLVHLYPGTWPPFARGVLWLAVGAAAVVFDLLMLDIAETERGRTLLLAVAGMTGLCFFTFAVGSFARAPWSVVH